MPITHRNLESGPVDVVIRPEAIRLVEPSVAGCLAAKVVTATYMGANVEYNLYSAVGALFVIAPEADRLHAVGVALTDRGVFAVKP